MVRSRLDLCLCPRDDPQEALEKSGVADRSKVSDAIRALDMTDGPALFFPDGRLTYDEKGRRVGAKICVGAVARRKASAGLPPSIATHDVLCRRRRQALVQRDGLVSSDVASLRHAERAVQAGTDGSILVAAGTGGLGDFLSGVG